MYHCTAHLNGYDLYLKLQLDIENFQQISNQMSLFFRLTILKAHDHIEYTQSYTNIVLAPVMSINIPQVRKIRSIVGFI